MTDMQDHPLGIAARSNDADAEQVGLQGAIEKRGLDVRSVMYIAEQRALRVLALEEPTLSHLLGYKPKPIPVRLNDRQKRKLIYYQSAILDGILIGWRAKELS